MSKPQFAILRFAKYKGPEIGHIEAHNERSKEKYASNPDVDTSRSHLNFHLVTPQRRKGRAAGEEAECRGHGAVSSGRKGAIPSARFLWHKRNVVQAFVTIVSCVLTRG